MSRLCTNPNQSNQLIKHGFMVQAADAWWSEYAWINNGTPICVHVTEPQLYVEQYTENDIPAWSLETLLHSMPSSIKIDKKVYRLHITKEQDIYLIEYTSETGTWAYRDGRDLIDIAVQMVIYLLKNHISLNPAYILNNI